MDPEYGAGYLSRANLHAVLGNDEQAQEDMEIVRHLGEKNVQEFADDHNILRSVQLRLEPEEASLESDRSALPLIGLFHCWHWEGIS